MATEKEIIEIYEKIWHADIIKMTEPLYSIALCTVERWMQRHESMNEMDKLKLTFAFLLGKHWCELLGHEFKQVIVRPELHPGGLELFAEEMKQKYSNSDVLITIVKELYRSMRRDD